MEHYGDWQPTSVGMSRVCFGNEFVGSEVGVGNTQNRWSCLMSNRPPTKPLATDLRNAVDRHPTPFRLRLLAQEVCKSNLLPRSFSIALAVSKMSPQTLQPHMARPSVRTPAARNFLITLFPLSSGSRCSIVRPRQFARSFSGESNSSRGTSPARQTDTRTAGPCPARAR
jgi:hypothetical protein